MLIYKARSVPTPKVQGEALTTYSCVDDNIYLWSIRPLLSQLHKLSLVHFGFYLVKESTQLEIVDSCNYYHLNISNAY